jgi:putative restriction endonuclease
VRWHAAGGQDTADNGLCLCTFHHKAFDRGAIGLTDDHRVLVSQHVRGSTGIDEWLLQFVGSTINQPLPGEPPPSPSNVVWHRREVFREPPRSQV